jgi:diacylglycerol O-acyltransferase / wax synthase
MPQLQKAERLSWGDAAFLYLEREGTPLNVASLCVFEGKIALEDCVALVESKLPLIPRYTQRVLVPPYNIGLPTWEPAPRFDIREHIREEKLKRGTEVELKQATSSIMSEVMDRTRPLWDLTLLQGLRRGRTGVVARIHHCLADGIAGIGLMNVLLDSTPTPQRSPKKSKNKRGQAEPQRDSGAGLLESLANAYSQLLSKALATEAEVLKVAQGIVAQSGTGPFAELSSLLPEITAPAERLPFNQVCKGPQKFAWASVPMAEFKAIRERCGGTFNDVVLTIVTSAFRKYAEAHKVNTAHRLLRLVVPVNVRGSGDVGELGNRISFVPVPAPLDIRNARELLANISQRTHLIKNAHLAEFVGMFGALLAAIPTSVQALIGPIASRLPLSVCNVICTNVPGPQMPIYLLGRRMTAWYPYVPIGGEMGVNCAILTYDGQAYFGFTGDAHAAPDLERLEQFVTDSLVELRKAAGIRSRTNIGRTVRVRRPRAQAETKTKTGPAPAPVSTKREKAAQDAVLAVSA